MKKLLMGLSALVMLLFSGCATSSPARGTTEGNSATQLKKSCDLNNGFGCAKLGLLYADGVGVKKDFSKSYKYFKKSCDLNSGMGCSYLGISYMSGLGVRQNTSIGKKYLHKGCDLNNGEGCYRLGMFYGKKDDSKANKYYKKACDLKNAQGCLWYTILKQKGY